MSIRTRTSGGVKFIKLGSTWVPEIVMKDVIPTLDYYDLSTLRLVDSTMNEMIVKYTSYYDNMIIKIRSVEDFENSQIPIHCSRFYVMLTETEDFNAFLRKRGSQIKHLQLKYTQYVEYVNSLCELEYLCPELTSIYLADEWPLNELFFYATLAQVHAFTQRITQLSINAKMGSETGEDFQELQKFLRFFTKLETFRLELASDVKAVDNYRFTDEMMSYVNYRCGNDYPPSPSYKPFSTMFFESVNMMEINLQELDKVCCNKLQEVCCRITALHLRYRGYGALRSLGSALDKLHNVTDVSVELGQYELPSCDLNAWRSEKMAFKNVKKLCLKMTPSCQESNIELATTVFGFHHNEISNLKLEVCTNEGEVPRMNDLHRSVLELLKTLKRVTHLSLVNYYHLEWVTTLGNTLERLDVEGVEMLRYEDFVGDGLDDIDFPVFCRFPSLCHLSLARKECSPPMEQGLADRLFEKVFRNMQLISFDISKFCPVSRRALELLIGSVFASTIKHFPYSCMSDVVDSGEGAASNYNPEYCTATEFEEFQKQHFKFFQ